MFVTAVIIQSERSLLPGPSLPLPALQAPVEARMAPEQPQNLAVLKVLRWILPEMSLLLIH